MMPDLMIGVGVDMLSDAMLSVMEIIAMATPAITLEFVGSVSYVTDVLTGVLTVLIIGVVTAMDVDILADGSGNGLAAVMTPFEFTLSSP